MSKTPMFLCVRDEFRDGKMIQPMTNFLVRFIQEDRGQDLIEYALLAAFLGLAILAGMDALTSGLEQHYENIGSILAGS